MKRPHEDRSSAESDAEEPVAVYPGRSNASHGRCASPTTTTQATARKQRRGVIEKRRRDRINGSLSELRQLVPAALEKQGSAKLEKAEILQLTVDHLKMLQATGGKGCLHALALDFLSLGFRECVAEASRYLAAVEGLDSSDPLRCRLLSHLSCCASRRDAAALTAASHPSHRQPHPFLPHRWAATFQPPYGLSGLPVSADAVGGVAPQRLAELSQRPALSSYSSHTDSLSPSSSSSSSLMLPCAPAPLPVSLLSLSTSFPIAIHAGLPILHPSSFSSTTITSSPPISSSSSHTPHSSSSSKPYRPWGTEVGAF